MNKQKPMSHDEFVELVTALRRFFTTAEIAKGCFVSESSLLYALRNPDGKNGPFVRDRVQKNHGFLRGLREAKIAKRTLARIKRNGYFDETSMPGVFVGRRYYMRLRGDNDDTGILREIVYSDEPRTFKGVFEVPGNRRSVQLKFAHRSFDDLAPE